MKHRDRIILLKIIQYAHEIDGTIIRMELDYDKFSADYIAKNAISMCILQIGELAGNLTMEFRVEHSKIPWRAIISMRNRAAHAYAEMDLEIIWQVASENIPELKAYCNTLLK